MKEVEKLLPEDNDEGGAELFFPFKIFMPLDKPRSKHQINCNLKIKTQMSLK